MTIYYGSFSIGIVNERRVATGQDGVKVWFDDDGSGPAILMLHGFPDTAQLWDAQRQQLLDEGYRVITPDLPGFGESDKPAEISAYAMAASVGDMFTLVGQLSVDRYLVVGHDFGSALAWVLASVDAQRVAGVAALSVGHPGAFRSSLDIEQRRRSWYMLFFQFPEAEAALQADDWALFRALFGAAHGVDEYVERLKAPGALSSALNWYRANLSPAALAHPQPPLPPIACPVLGMWGANDEYVLEPQMTSSSAFVDGVWRYERVSGAGHWIPTEAPELVGELLVNFAAHLVW